MGKERENKFTTIHLLYFIFLNIIMTTDAGFDAPLISKMISTFGVTDVDVAILMSFMAISIAIFLPIWGIVADKVNRVHMIFVSVCLGSIVSFFTVITIELRTEFWVFCVMRLLAAIINTSLGPAIFTLLVDFVPAKNRGGIIGWMGIAGTAAVGLGMIVSGIIPTIFYGEDFPLQFPFWFDFIAGIISCGLTLLLREPKRGATEEALKELHEQGETYNFSLTLNGALDFFRVPINLKIFFFNFLTIIVNTVLGKFFIRFLESQYGIGSGLATLIMFMIFGVQLAGQIVWGNKGDVEYRKKKEGRLNVMIMVLGIGMCFLIPAFLVPFNFEELFWLFPVFAILLSVGSFFGVGCSPNTGVIVAEINFPEVRATVNSIMFLANTAATAIFAPIFTILAITTPLNYSGTYFLFILICFPTAFLILLTIKKPLIPRIDFIQAELKKRIEPQIK